ncbi:MAG: hypothetical protein ABIO38_04565 [Luteimonas sp.]
MRNSRRWQIVSWTVLLSAPFALVLPWLLSPDAASDGLKAGLFCYGLMALVFGVAAVSSVHREQRARQALARGEGVLARWRLTAQEWGEFTAFEQQRQQQQQQQQQQQPGSPPYNELILPGGIPTEGVDVVVGQDAVQIHDSLFRLPLRGSPEVQSAKLQDNGPAPSTIELHLKYPASGAGASGVIREPTYTLLRFPLPGTAWREGRRVAAHFNRDLPGKPDFFHGRGDGTDAEDLSRCWRCGFETYKYRSQCERCGGSLQSRRWSRRFGFVLTLCGLFLTSLMGVVIHWMVPRLLHAGVDVDGSRFTGTEMQALGSFAVVGAVFVFGATALGYGIWQMATGRRDRRVVFVMIAIASGLMMLAYLL